MLIKSIVYLLDNWIWKIVVSHRLVLRLFFKISSKYNSIPMPIDHICSLTWVLAYNWNKLLDNQEKVAVLKIWICFALSTEWICILSYIFFFVDFHWFRSGKRIFKTRISRPLLDSLLIEYLTIWFVDANRKTWEQMKRKNKSFDRLTMSLDQIANK